MGRPRRGGTPSGRAARCPLRRRSFLTAAGALAVAAMAGCLGDDGAVDPEPVALTDGQTCAVCGMEIAAHFGPAAQAFYGGEADPVGFDSVLEFVEYDAHQEMTGESLLAGFATDYSAVDYDLEESAGDRYISTHAEAKDFAELGTLHFVVDSAVRGAMGPDAMPFSERADADVFATEHGGDVVSWRQLRDR